MDNVERARWLREKGRNKAHLVFLFSCSSQSACRLSKNGNEPSYWLRWVLHLLFEMDFNGKSVRWTPFREFNNSRITRNLKLALTVKFFNVLKMQPFANIRFHILINNTLRSLIECACKESYNEYLKISFIRFYEFLKDSFEFLKALASKTVQNCQFKIEDKTFSCNGLRL